MGRRLPALLVTTAAAAGAAVAACGSAEQPAAAPSTVTVTVPNPPPTTVAGGPTIPAAPAGQAATNAPAAAPAPSTVTIPAVKGKNGAIAQDELKQLGLTNVRLAADPASGKSTVLLPENWTVTKVEPAAGTQVPTSQLVVLTMTK